MKGWGRGRGNITRDKTSSPRRVGEVVSDGEVAGPSTYTSQARSPPPTSPPTRTPPSHMHKYLGRRINLKPWNTMPHACAGPVILAPETMGFLLLCIAEMLTDLGGDVSREMLEKIEIRVRCLQGECFESIEKLYGARGTTKVERQRYNLKAFTEPIMDSWKEFLWTWVSLTPRERQAKALTLRWSKD